MKTKNMDELTQIPSRLGQVSTAVAILDFLVVGLLVLTAILAAEFLRGSERQLDLQLSTVALMAVIIFPCVAVIALIIGVIGYFQTDYAKFYSILGISLNGLNIVIFIGVVFYQITFNANRFRM
jgi:Kef-type K+ transport system membrane component KefB